MINEALKKICLLQPTYSAENTPEMQERGKLLRNELKPGIEALAPTLAPLLGRFGATFRVRASDGIGRKTELPWVGFCSEEMSPGPTDGFYNVIHFSTDGSGVHITVGCSSSGFRGGYAVIRSDRELDAQTAWARGLIEEEFGSLEPFADPIDFGARRPLPISFERATAFSKRIDFTELDRTDVAALLAEAARRLKFIYDAQAQGRNLTPAEVDEMIFSEIARPSTSHTGQGFGLTAAERRAVEQHAMARARIWLEENGYEVADRSMTHPFDLEAKRDGSTIKIEVKGTTSDLANAILMTRNEVELHRKEHPATALIIVSQIRLIRTNGNLDASGGKIEPFLHWNINDWEIEPFAFRVTRAGQLD